MRRNHLIVVAALIAGMILGGCSAPGETPQSTASIPPSVTGYDPPSRFDLMNTVRLAGADGTTQGVLDGLGYFTMDNKAMVIDLDVRTGQMIWHTPLVRSGMAASGAWKCPLQVVDDNFVYTMAATQPPGDTPTTIALTANDKATGQVAWRYAPATTAQFSLDYCDVNPVYQLTVTKTGLLLSFTDSSGDPYAEMLDTSGAVIWHTDNTVQATSEAAFGIAVNPPYNTPGGSPVKVWSIDLATGQLGDVLADAGFMITYTPDVFLAGQSGGNLVVVRQDEVIRSPGDNPDGAPWVTQITQVSASTGHQQPTPPVFTAPGGWDACTVASDTALVCTTQDKGIPTAFGVSLADGKTLWQHAYAPATDLLIPPAVTLFDGYLYGVDADGKSFVLDTATGNVLASDSYPRLTAVNQYGLAFAVTDSTGAAWQCWWAPAIS